MGAGFVVSYAQAMHSVTHSLLLLPVDQDVDLSAPSAPCLPTPCHLPTMTTMDWTSRTVSQPQINVFCYKSCLGHKCLFTTMGKKVIKVEIISKNEKTGRVTYNLSTLKSGGGGGEWTPVSRKQAWSILWAPGQVRRLCVALTDS
jgi:hypothetical protein